MSFLTAREEKESGERRCLPYFLFRADFRAALQPVVRLKMINLFFNVRFYSRGIIPFFS